MPRYGCFEIKTRCGSCGQPVPVNGPFRMVTCTSCFSDVNISVDTLAGFLNDFENDYEGIDPGEGMGGTLMGSGTYDYSFWRIKPRCSSCSTEIPEQALSTEDKINCKKCGKEYHVFPAPEQVQELVPSAVQCIGPEPGSSSPGAAEAGVDETSLKPVVMSCPQCGGALSITDKSERILDCEFCSTDVYVPDPIWKRLHPVKKSDEWFIRFEGKNRNELINEQRAIDDVTEKDEQKNWQPRELRRRTRKWLKPAVITVAAMISSIFITIFIMELAAYGIKETAEVIKVMAFAYMIIIFLALTLSGALYYDIAYKYGNPGKCKRAMSRIAQKNGWKHQGVEHSKYMGYVDAKYRGHDIKIQPDNDYAIEVDLDDSPFYLKTEAPGYPPDKLLRFSSSNSDFNRIFPVRYAEPAFVKKIKNNSKFDEMIVSPFLWIFNRWNEKLAMLKVDWSDLGAHLAPGHRDSSGSSIRYLFPDEIEPLLSDLLVVAEAIEDIYRGKKPELPS